MFYFLSRHVSDRIVTGKLAEALQKETELWPQLLKRWMAPCIYWINHYSLDDSTGFCSSYPMDRDLSTKYLNTFEQLGLSYYTVNYFYLFLVLQNMQHKNLVPMKKFSLSLKKAGLASRIIVHLQKNPSTLCRLLLLFSSFYT